PPPSVIPRLGGAGGGRAGPRSPRSSGGAGAGAALHPPVGRGPRALRFAPGRGAAGGRASVPARHLSSDPWPVNWRLDGNSTVVSAVDVPTHGDGRGVEANWPAELPLTSSRAKIRSLMLP